MDKDSIREVEMKGLTLGADLPALWGALGDQEGRLSIEQKLGSLKAR